MAAFAFIKYMSTAASTKAVASEVSIHLASYIRQSCSALCRTSVYTRTDAFGYNFVR